MGDDGEMKGRQEQPCKRHSCWGSEKTWCGLSWYDDDDDYLNVDVRFEHSGFYWKFHILQKGAVISRDIQRKRPPGASKELDPFKEMSFVSLSLKRMSSVALGQKR